MIATQELRDLGQSVWLDNITRELLEAGTIQHYIDDYGVSGLTSNPSIFEQAIASGAYDEDIVAAARQGLSHEEIFFHLALDDLRRAADLFAPIHRRTDGVDGWVSLEVSPLLAYDTARTVASVADLHQRAGRANLFVKIPGTPEGLPAIEESVAAGIAVNVTLLFDAAQYRAAADAYLRGVERRIAAGLNPAVGSVASLFISRWDVAVATTVPADLRNRLGLAVGHEVYQAYREWLASPRVQRALNFGGRPQRLLWASTKTKDPAAPDTLYVEGLTAPFTINTMPDSTLAAVVDHATVTSAMAPDGVEHREVLARFAAAGVDTVELAGRLQREGAAAFTRSWNELLSRIDTQLTPTQETP